MSINNFLTHNKPVGFAPNEYKDGEYYSRKAAEHSKLQTEAENLRRRENGRKPNVSAQFEVGSDEDTLHVNCNPN